MSGDRKKKPVEIDGPSPEEISRAWPWEADDPDPDDLCLPDPPESLQLDTRIWLLPKSWQQPARDLIKECEDRGLSAAEMHLELDRLQSLFMDFSGKSSPDWKRAGGRSTEARDRWCNAILLIANPDDPAAFRKATKRAEVAAFAAIRDEEITDLAFKALKDCPWVGRKREGRPHPPTLKNIREAARERWGEKN